MSRNLDATMGAALSDSVICPIIMAVLTFKSQTCYVWSGVGNFAYGGNTYTGVGSLGKVGGVTEGIDVRADGTSVELSGVDALLSGETSTDIQIGAPAKLYLGLLNIATGTLIGSPYQFFAGTVDQPTFSIGAEKMSIKLALENKMADLQRPRMRRYTSADQRLQYPTDTAFSWVETLNDQALFWG